MIHNFLDVIFPPLCLACKERCETKFLCLNCWSLCELPDPVERCRHCFEPLDERGNLCANCRQARALSSVRAYVFDPESPAQFLDRERAEGLAAFAFLQWIELDWPTPDAVIPLPDSLAMAQVFATLLESPLVKALDSYGQYREGLLEEEGQLLLLDLSTPIEELEQAALALSESFPKRIYHLSLFPYVDSLY